MNLKDAVIEFCKITEIHKIGFTTAKPFYDIEMLLINNKRKGLPSVPFVENNISKRVYPELTLKGAKSFIVIIEGYTPTYYQQPTENALIGNISPAACEKDYHKIVNQKLTELKNFLLDIQPKANIMTFVDNSPFSEKHVALRAGLGQIGKNKMFFTKEFGSRCFIGLLLTDINFTEDSLIKEDRYCTNCNKCINACPTNALTNNEFDYTRCISYLTQSKNKITDELATLMGTQIYGCDICQSVCPQNKPIPKNCISGKDISLESLVGMSNAEFIKTLKLTAAGWLGKKQLQKNAIIALGNIGTPEGLEILECLKEDTRQDIKREVKRAIEKY